MFAQRLAGHSAARITRALNDAGIPCPSAADPRDQFTHNAIACLAAGRAQAPPENDQIITERDADVRAERS